MQANDAQSYDEVNEKGQPIVLLQGGLFGSTIEMAGFIDKMKSNFQIIAVSTGGTESQKLVKNH
ncbi:hypothetical protein GO730_03480 [Spirosoma sp. HMF3257]|uniref:Alpha/beta hydrolase n=1 Tax=Spirosoma telluris TaxID=2183553 RepID=A0A327NHC0_9BACT|nr:hypothetical protein [Spirosoma telluris]RAI73699.1 hypothetical protein HMF3257_03410 [Spirosoma telluris]